MAKRYIYAQKFNHRPRKNKRWKFYLMTFFILSLFFSTVYFCFFSSYFQAYSLEIKQNNNNNLAEINREVENFLEEKNLFFFSSRNLWLLSQKKLSKLLVEKYPRIESITITKQWPFVFDWHKLKLIKRKAKLIIKLKERKTTALWCQIKKIKPKDSEREEINFDKILNQKETTKEKNENNSSLSKENNSITKNCFYMDKNGIIFNPAPEIRGGLILLIEDRNQKKVKLGDQVLKPKIINILQEIKDFFYNQLSTNILSFDVSSLPDLIINLPGEWLVYLDSDQDIKFQLNILREILNKKIKNRTSLEYIDVRIINRVYYKLKSD